MVLTDRMASLHEPIVANQIAPNGAYVQFATHYGSRPNLCERPAVCSPRLSGYNSTDSPSPKTWISARSHHCSSCSGLAMKPS